MIPDGSNGVGRLTITPCVFLFKRILWITLLYFSNRHYFCIAQRFQEVCFLKAHVWCESNISVVFDVLLSVRSTTKYTSVPGCFDLREHVCDRPCWALDFSYVNCFITNSVSSVSEDTLSLLLERNFGRLFAVLVKNALLLTSNALIRVWLVSRVLALASTFITFASIRVTFSSIFDSTCENRLGPNRL